MLSPTHPLHSSPTNHASHPPLIFHFHRGVTLPNRPPTLSVLWPESYSTTPTPFHRTGIGTDYCIGLSSATTGFTTRRPPTRPDLQQLSLQIRVRHHLQSLSFHSSPSQPHYHRFPPILTPTFRSPSMEHPRSHPFPADTYHKSLLPAPFLAFVVTRKPTSLLRKISGSGRRLRRTSPLGMRDPCIAFPPFRSMKSPLGPFRPLNVHVRSPDPPLSRPPPPLPSRPRRQSPAAVVRLPINKPNHRRTMICRTLHTGSVTDEAEKRGSHCADCLVESLTDWQRKRNMRETAWWRLAGNRLFSSTNLLGPLLSMGLVYLVVFRPMGLWVFTALWLVHFVVIARVSTTPRTGKPPSSDERSRWPPSTSFPPTLMFIWMDWLEDRDKHFADDSVHRFKLRHSASISIRSHYLLPRVSTDISQVHRPDVQSRDHIRRSVWGLDQVYPDSSLVKSLLFEKFGLLRHSPRAPVPMGYSSDKSVLVVRPQAASTNEEPCYLPPSLCGCRRLFNGFGVAV